MSDVLCCRGVTYGLLVWHLPGLHRRSGYPSFVLIPRRRSTKVEQHFLDDNHVKIASSTLPCTVVLLMPRVAPHQLDVDVYKKHKLAFKERRS